MEGASVDGIQKGQVGSLTANYTTETHVYSASGATNLDNTSIAVKVYCATTTVGGNLVSSDRDLTGIMIWPATHLLCHQLASEMVGEKVVELGAGVGLVGLVSTKAHPHTVWVSTDGDMSAVDMCRQNFELNEIPVNQEEGTSFVKQLEWGNQEQIQTILNHARRIDGETATFDSVVAADIVYPATCGEALKALFGTVDQLLKPGGTFVLSFVSRDGPKTPRQLIESASEAGFRIDALPPLDEHTKAGLPPLLDARILLLVRDSEAREKNACLGADNCFIFRGMNAAIARLDESSSEEEWDAPFGDSDDDDE